MDHSRRPALPGAALALLSAALSGISTPLAIGQRRSAPATAAPA